MKGILILGGDERQKSLARLFEKENVRVFSAFDDAELEKLRPISKYETIILPVPCSKNKKHVFSEGKVLSLSLDAIAAAAKNTTVLIGGGFPDGFCAAAQDNGATLFDLLGEKDFALFNAHLTAQGIRSGSFSLFVQAADHNDPAGHQKQRKNGHMCHILS